jgi:hypothetical protein
MGYACSPDKDTFECVFWESNAKGGGDVKWTEQLAIPMLQLFSIDTPLSTTLGMQAHMKVTQTATFDQ